MPELPDIVVYLEALEPRIRNQTLERVTIALPFLLRTAVPPITSVAGRQVVDLRRLGKRICIGLEGDLWLVLHLMIAGLAQKVAEESRFYSLFSLPRWGRVGVGVLVPLAPLPYPSPNGRGKSIQHQIRVYPRKPAAARF